jgi:hypothetical protein
MSFARSRSLWLCLAVAGTVLASACKKEARRGPGSRGTVGEQSPIDLTAFPSDPGVTARILRMPFEEATQRLGSLDFEARTFFVFNRGGEERELTQLGRLTQDAAGNFHVASDTGQNQVELYLIDENVYVRQDKGRLRKKPRRDVSTEAWRDLVWSSMQQTLSLFAPRLRFIDARPDTAAGRQAVRYRVSLAPEGETGVALPAAVPPLPLAPTSRWREIAHPLSATGSLWIDSATGVVLKIKVEGRLEVADRDVRPTQLTLRFDGTVTKPGAVAAVVAPESIPEYERTPPPADPLSFFRAEIKEAGSAAVVPGAAAMPTPAPAR